MEPPKNLSTLAYKPRALIAALRDMRDALAPLLPAMNEHELRASKDRWAHTYSEKELVSILTSDYRQLGAQNVFAALLRRWDTRPDLDGTEPMTTGRREAMWRKLEIARPASLLLDHRFPVAHESVLPVEALFEDRELPIPAPVEAALRLYCQYSGVAVPAALEQIVRSFLLPSTICELEAEHSQWAQRQDATAEEELDASLQRAATIMGVWYPAP